MARRGVQTDTDREAEALDVGGAPVPLARRLQHAMHGAPALAVARAEVRLADEAFGAADPLFPNPTLSVGLGPRFGQRAASDLDVQISLQLPIELAGPRPLRFEAARAARATREHAVERARWDVHQRLRAGYGAALVARARAALARRIAEFQRDLAALARRRVEAGESPPLMQSLAEAEAAQAEQRAVAALQTYREACLLLAELSGWSAEQPPEPVGELEPPRPAPPLAQLVELARAHDPSLGVRHAALAEARARAALADREAWPTLAVGVQYNRGGAPGGGPAEDSILGVLTLPIPSFQLNQAERADATARVEVALAERDALLAVLAARLEARRTAVNAAVARVAAYGADIVPRFAENLRLLRRAFEAGELDVLQVSLALERFLAIQLEPLDAYVDYATAVAALEAQVGVELGPTAP